MRRFSCAFAVLIALLLNVATKSDESIGLPVRCPFGYTEEAEPWEEHHLLSKRSIEPYNVRSSTLNDYSLEAILRSININAPIPPSWLTMKKSEPIKCGVAPLDCLNNTHNLHYRSIDGSCNNLLYPEYGIAPGRYSRLLRPTYVESTAPNARLISLSMYGEDTVMDKHRTVASMQFGQFVAHDISLLTTKGAPKNCCENSKHPRCQPIRLAVDGPIAYNTGKSCIHFARAVSDKDAICAKSDLPYGEKLSVVTAYLDLSSIYGNSMAQSRKVRLFKGGQLRTSYHNGQQWLPISHNPEECGERHECYTMPDKRNRFTPTVAVLHTVMLREHNRLADQLALINPYYDDERLYQEARKINIAQYQKITYYDWLVGILGSTITNSLGLTHPYADYVNDYDESINASPLAEYAAAAFRYSHTQIPGWFSLVAPSRYSNQTMRLSDYFARAETIDLLQSDYNLADLVRGMATQLQKRSDSNIDPEIKHYFNRKEFEEYGSDLKTLDIQRARDFKIASYNDAREVCGLRRAIYWDDFAGEISKEKIELLRKFYASPDLVELSVGGTLEVHVPGSIFGPTVLCIVGKQFQHTRQADRFWYERQNHLSGFTRPQLSEIRKVTLASLFCNNVQGLYDIQPNVFMFPNSRNHLLSCHDLPHLDITKWQEQSRY